MRSRPLLSLILTLAFTQVASASDRILLVQPGGPGSPEQARRTMDAFADALSAQAPELKGLAAEYHNTLETARKAVASADVAYAILTVDAYLVLRETSELRLVAAATRLGGKPRQYLVVTHRDGPKTLGALRGKAITRAGLPYMRFLSAVVLGTDAAKFSWHEARSPLRAIRDVARQKKVAAIVDARTLRALGESENARMKAYLEALRVVHRSPELPAPPVVAIEGRGTPAALTKGLLGLASGDAGQAVLTTFGLAGFQAARPETYDAIETLYAKWKPKPAPKR